MAHVPGSDSTIIQLGVQALLRPSSGVPGPGSMDQANAAYQRAQEAAQQGKEDGMSGMAEVLERHHMSHSDWEENQFAVLCHCGTEIAGEDNGDEAYLQEEALYAGHLAAALTAAGFGELRPAQLGALMAYDAIEESALTEARAQALEDAADAILTNDPLDFWSQHLPEGLGFQEAMSLWLKAHAAAVRGER